MWRRHPPNELTPREQEVFELLRRGLTNEEIARRLDISVAGAKYHVSQILSKFGVATREEAATGWPPERQSWLRKLAWIGVAGAVATALTGVAFVVSDRGKGVIFESGVFTDESVAALATHPPADETAPDTTTPSPSPPAGAAVQVPTTSPQTAVGENGLPPAALRPKATKTPVATATGWATPAPPAGGSGVPGGSGRIAFVSGSDIHVMAHDGSGRTNVTSGPEADWDPAWSPDGTKIAFSRDTGAYTSYESYDIFVANADGSGLANLTNNPGTNSHPTWSPDGSRIAFINGWNLSVANVDGSGITNLTNNHATDYPLTWSPDGARLAFIHDYDLWVMNADGSGATRIFGGPPHPQEPSWSPDGSKIAFYATHGQSGSDIFTVNHDGSQLSRLTTSPGHETDPTWSPDGTRIAFVTPRDYGDSYYGEIYIMNAVGSNQAQLTHMGGNQPSWSPDGGTIAFGRLTAGIWGNWEIYSIRVDGTNEVNLTHSASAEYELDWQPLPPSSTASELPVPSPTGSAAATQSTAASLLILALTREPAALSRAALPSRGPKRAMRPASGATVTRRRRMPSVAGTTRRLSR